MVQASLKAVLEPIFEAEFKPCSYGFRPNRRQHDAIAEIQHFTTRGYEWVLEADIKACFDEISHTALMARLRVRVKDKRVCGLVTAFLKSGVMDATGNREDTLSGTPQGGILSPLLANIALSALDDHFDRQWRQEMGTEGRRARRKKNGLGNWRIVRFADDFVVMVAGERRHAEALREQVAAVLAPLGLRLAPDKTRVVHIDEGFDFLSIHIRRLRKRGQRSTTSTPPRPKAVQLSRSRRSARRSTRHISPDEYLPTSTGSRRLSPLPPTACPKQRSTPSTPTPGVDRCADFATSLRANRLGMKELRRRFYDKGWSSAYDGLIFTGASSVSVRRFATAAAPSPPRGPSNRQQPAVDQRPRHVERPVR